jgi:hypothetical protein
MLQRIKIILYSVWERVAGPLCHSAGSAKVSFHKIDDISLFPLLFNANIFVIKIKYNMSIRNE